MEEPLISQSPETSPERETFDQWTDLRAAMTGDFLGLLDDIFVIRSEQVGNRKELVERLAARDWDLPSVTFLEGRDTHEWLTKHPEALKRRGTMPDAITVFNLPLPLARFWSKDSRRYDGQAQAEYSKQTDESEMSGIWPPANARWQGVNEWGRLYSHGIWELHDLINYLEYHRPGDDPPERFRGDERLEKLEAALNKYGGWGERLNSERVHDPKAYYYVWGWWRDK